MIRNKLVRFIIHSIIGMITGIVIIHPAAMLLQDMTFSSFSCNVENIFHSFSFEHLPMTLSFALLGCILGLLHAFYIQIILMRNKRIDLLEKFLPMCSSCKKIRINDESNADTWVEIEYYLIDKTGTSVSHGICPDCSKKLYPEL